MVRVIPRALEGAGRGHRGRGPHRGAINRTPDGNVGGVRAENPIRGCEQRSCDVGDPAVMRRQGLQLLVTPETILRWHRDIVRRRWAARSIRGKTGRPATRRNIRALILRLASENPGWGYRRIHGELAGLGIKVAASTVWEILKVNGIDPARHRAGPTWPQFLRSQADAILASDFFTVDLLDGTQACVLAVIEHATRRIRILGVTPHPTGE
jgi:putative transposase